MSLRSSARIWSYIGRKFQKRSIPANFMPYINLDAIDLKILRALQDDGRLTNNELADQVGLSPSPCLRRVRRLERDGFIRTYRAVLDRESVGLGLTVFVEIKVEKHSRDNAKALQIAL